MGKKRQMATGVTTDTNFHEGVVKCLILGVFSNSRRSKVQQNLSSLLLPVQSMLLFMIAKSNMIHR